ncbi:MAG: hypothetical protein ACPGVU_00390 [Limisphaerales bacterium]
MEENDPIVARPRRRNTFPYQAAKIGTTIPPIALLASVVMRTVSKKIDWMEVLDTGIYPLGFVETAACAMGVLFALIALCAIPAQGTKGLLFPGVGGLVMSAGLLALAVLQLKQKELHERQTMAIEAAQDELQHAMLDRYIQKRDYALSLGDIAGLVDQVDNVDVSTTQRTILLQVSADLRQQTAEWSDRFEKQVRAFSDANLLDIASIDTKAEVAERKQQAQGFLNATIEFRDYIAELDSAMQTMLAGTSLDDETQIRFRTTFLANSKAEREIVMQIREQDVRVATAARDLLDLLETTWGKWIHDPDDKITEFDTKELAEQFHKLTKDLKNASTESLHLQEHLFSPKR